MHYFSLAVSRQAKSVALVAADGFERTWEEYFSEVRSIASAMMLLGVEQFSSVSILGFNSPEWFIANFASIFCGAKAAGVYSTNGMRYLLI
jgi:long-chain-fatty-acid--CoA ligase ACSBG